MVPPAPSLPGGLHGTKEGSLRPRRLTSAEHDDFLTLGPQLPAIWQQPGIDRPHKKELLRCLVDTARLTNLDLYDIVIHYRSLYDVVA